jgi:hypothetical protein
MKRATTSAVLWFAPASANVKRYPSVMLISPWVESSVAALVELALLSSQRGPFVTERLDSASGFLCSA